MVTHDVDEAVLLVRPHRDDDQRPGGDDRRDRSRSTCRGRATASSSPRPRTTDAPAARRCSSSSTAGRRTSKRQPERGATAMKHRRHRSCSASSCVGNGMAGVRTLEELLKLAPDLYDITVFGAEPHPELQPHPALAGARRRADARRDRAQRARVVRGATASRCTSARRSRRSTASARVVVADDGTEAPYDRLLLATGSNPFILPIPGKDLPGVITYRDIADTEAMIDAAATLHATRS